MSKNRISMCTSDFGCLMNPFYVPDRIKDPYQSSSGIDLNPYEFNKYENFNTPCQNCGNSCQYNCPYRNKQQKCNNKMSLYNVNLVNLILIIIIIIFLIYKLK